MTFHIDKRSYTGGATSKEGEDAMPHCGANCFFPLKAENFNGTEASGTSGTTANRCHRER